MMMGKTENGFKGIDLIEDTLVNGPQLATVERNSSNKTKGAKFEQLHKFVMQDMLNKDPIFTDINNPTVQFKEEEAPDPNIFMENKAVQVTNVEDVLPEQLKELSKDALRLVNGEDQAPGAPPKRGTTENLVNFLEDLRKVDTLAKGKMAMQNLYNSQAQTLKNQVLPGLTNKDLLKLNKSAGKDPKDMMKDMPSYVLMKQVHDLSKEQIIQSYKKLGKEMIMDRVQMLPSQALAGAALNVLTREDIFNKYAKNEKQMG
jgi:hypothetical protein